MLSALQSQGQHKANGGTGHLASKLTFTVGDFHMSKRALLTVSILIALATPALASAQSAENAQRNADKSDAGQRNAPVAIKYGEARGIVSNAFTGKALEGALIRVRESGETARTDSNGLYRFVGLQTGRYTLDISYLGFATAERRVRVRRGEVVVANINLGDKEDTVKSKICCKFSSLRLSLFSIDRSSSGVRESVRD